MKKLLQWVFRKLGVRDREGLKALVIQFIKFGLVGVSNTAISYGVEMLGYYVIFSNVSWPERLRIVVVTVIAFAVSVVNSYYWNNRFVFKGGRTTLGAHLRAFLKMTGCYALTGLVLAPVLKVWISEAGVPYWLASLLPLVVTVPLNFLLNKLWAFRGGKAAPEGDE